MKNLYETLNGTRGYTANEVNQLLQHFLHGINDVEIKSALSIMTKQNERDLLDCFVDIKNQRIIAVQQNQPLKKKSTYSCLPRSI